MRYVLDASVAVASLRANEPNHTRAVTFLTPLIKGIDSIVVPSSIFCIEVASALARAGFAMREVERFVAAFLARADVVTIGPVRARRIQRVAVTTRLRAADAMYVWLAAHEGLALVTADLEIHERAAAVCQLANV